MANFNKVILVGNLTRDPQLTYLPNQTPVCEIGLAINRKYKEKEETCFVDCNAFGKLAEIITQYVRKGSPVLIEGRLQYQQWEKDGQKRSKLRVIIESCQFLGSGDQSQQRPTQTQGGYQQPARPTPQPTTYAQPGMTPAEQQAQQQPNAYNSAPSDDYGDPTIPF